MQRFQHIVAGIDEGALADSAVVTALHLSRLLRARLEVVHGVRTRAERPWLASDKLLEHLEAEVMSVAHRSRAAQLFKLLQPFAITHAEIEAMLHILPGRPSTMLATHIAEREGCMAVLGGHRHRRLFDAGTARELMVRPQCPIWLQGTRPWREIRSILVLLDLSPGSSPILAVARDLAAMSGASITAMHCFDPPVYSHVPEVRVEEIHANLEARAREEFGRFMAKEPCEAPRVEPLFETGALVDVVLDAQSRHDLVVMGTHGHTAVSRVLVGSHALGILDQARGPIVVVPQPTIG